MLLPNLGNFSTQVFIVEGSPEDGRPLQGRSVWCPEGIDSCFGQLRAATGHGFPNRLHLGERISGERGWGQKSVSRPVGSFVRFAGSLSFFTEVVEENRVAESFGFSFE